MPLLPSLAFVPGSVPLQRAESVLASVRHNEELREVFGGNEYDDQRTVTLARLDHLNEEHHLSEQFAAPVRLALQTGSERTKQKIREGLSAEGLTESDLCTAWHHVAPERRRLLFHVSRQLGALVA